MNPVILYDNRLTDGTSTATDTAAGFDVRNLSDWRTYTAWRAASPGTKYITIDCGSTKYADTLGICCHNLGTVAATVSLESSATGAWTGEQIVRVAEFTPTTDRTIMKLFTPASARYWRIKLITATVAPQMAIAVVGSRLEWPWPPEAPFVPQRRRTILESSRSRQGHLLGSVIKYKEITIKAKFAMLPRSWVDAHYEPFFKNHYSLKIPFLWAWDLTAYPEMVHLVVADGDAEGALPLSMSEYYDAVELSMEGIEE